jgi:glycogen debranching enzyme
MNWFKVQDIAVNCVYASGWGVLGDLAATFDPSLATRCHKNAAHVESSIMDTLYDENTGHFVTGYKNGKNEQCFHPAKTIQMLFPLLLPDLPVSHRRSIISYLTSPSEFGCPYPIPSVSISESSYNPVQDSDCLWRGPMWGFTNWFILEGLALHGEERVLNEIVDRWIDMAKIGGIWENHNPETAVGYGAEGLGMSCLIVDWMRRLQKG